MDVSNLHVGSASFQAARKGDSSHLEMVASFAEIVGRERLITISMPDALTAVVWFWTDEQLEEAIEKMTSESAEPARKTRKSKGKKSRG